MNPVGTENDMRIYKKKINDKTVGSLISKQSRLGVGGFS